MLPFPLSLSLRIERLFVIADSHLCAPVRPAIPDCPSPFSASQSWGPPVHICKKLLSLCFKTYLFAWRFPKLGRERKRQVTCPWIRCGNKASMTGEGLLTEWEIRNWEGGGGCELWTLNFAYRFFLNGEEFRTQALKLSFGWKTLKVFSQAVFIWKY